MEEFEEEPSPGGRERLQIKELEALQEEIISKLTVNAFLEQGPSAQSPSQSQPISTLNHSSLPQGALEAGWEGYASPGQQMCPDVAPQEALDHTVPATTDLHGKMRDDTITCMAANYQQQVWQSPRTKPVHTPGHPAVDTPNQYPGKSVGGATTQSIVTTPTYPKVTPPTQSVTVPSHQTNLEESATRVNLVEKHAKHISDLTAYYEGEIKKLREQASHPVQHPSSSEPTYHQWRPLVGSSGGPVHSPALVHSPSLVGSPVKTALQFSRSPYKPSSPGSLAAGDRVARLQEDLEDLHQRAATSDRMVHALRECLERERVRVRELEGQRNQLQEELGSAREEAEMARQELHSARSQRMSTEQQLREVLHELELSYAENRHFHTEYALLVEQLKSSESSAKNLRESLRTTEEEGQRARRTIQDLEEEVRQLRRQSNRDYSMASHHSFGQEGVSARALDSTPSHTPPMTLSTQAVSRRKWLEPSANGFVYGTPEGSRSGDRKLGSGDRKLRSRDRKQEAVGRDTHAPPPSTSLVDATPLSSLQHPSSLRHASEDHNTSNPFTARTVPHSTPSNLTPGSGGRSRGGRSVNFSLPDVAESTIAAVKRGRVISEEGAWHHTHNPVDKESSLDSDHSAGGSHEPSPPLSIEERVRDRMEKVAQAQKQFDQLQAEKQQLEAALSRVPISGRVTLHNRQQQRMLEARLDEVSHEIGLVKLVLRSNKAF